MMEEGTRPQASGEARRGDRANERASSTGGRPGKKALRSYAAGKAREAFSRRRGREGGQQQQVKRAERD